MRAMERVEVRVRAGERRGWRWVERWVEVREREGRVVFRGMERVI